MAVAITMCMSYINKDGYDDNFLKYIEGVKEKNKNPT